MSHTGRSATAFVCALALAAGFYSLRAADQDDDEDDLFGDDDLGFDDVDEDELEEDDDDGLDEDLDVDEL